MPHVQVDVVVLLAQDDVVVLLDASATLDDEGGFLWSAACDDAHDEDH